MAKKAEEKPKKEKKQIEKLPLDSGLGDICAKLNEIIEAVNAK